MSDLSLFGGAQRGAAGRTTGMGGHQSGRAGKDEWITPPSIVENLGPFDLDPCSRPNSSECRPYGIRPPRTVRSRPASTPFELVRWDHMIDKTPGDTFALNNVLTAPMARFVMEHEPDLDGMFETRERRSR